MEEYTFKDGRRLRMGYTTGTCAAAAAKAAAWMLLTGRKIEKIAIMTPKGIALNLDILEISSDENSVSCAVRKDSGDDPDVTGGSLVFASVSRIHDGIFVDGGKGVGRVTKPGLDQKVGQAAINSVPRKMIKENVAEVCSLTDYRGGLSVVISVPDGEKLAERTFNPRLGIEGGISILGTTGIVEPMSEKALTDTIKIELRQRRESGSEYVLLSPGNYGTEYIRESLKIDPEKAVLSSNFIGDTIDMCRELGFKGALLVGHIGKLVKLAGGMLNTHSKYGDCRMEILASNAAALGLKNDKAAEIMECVSCDEAIRILKEEGLCTGTMGRIAERAEVTLKRRAGENLKISAIMFSKQQGFLCRTEGAEELLQIIRED
ncbi:MAG: cobalt-precorrin-5B (C(1))-methyltransferase CbiD [Candidatus Limivicinus sp.]|jgi:cobalt-precorrin-5B (C1)-methyltransferase